MGKWSVGFIWSLRGSVIPKAMVWALPGAAVSFALHGYIREIGVITDNLHTTQMWQGYNFLIAFMLTFRTTQAYARWWEGGTLLQQARGEWFNAYSSLIAFCTREGHRKEEVIGFQRLLATLVSMLHCASLQQISQMDRTRYDVLELYDLADDSVKFLQGSVDKVEVLVLWIQKLIVINMDSGVLPIAPPVISRVFQELSRGVVNVNNVRKISEFLFPFPYAQMMTVMLLLHVGISPVLNGVLLEKRYWSGFASFISIFAFWSLNYVAAEIECPFGDDANDLPMHAMQRYMNRTLAQLLDDRAQTLPECSEQMMPAMHRGSLFRETLSQPREYRRAFKSIRSSMALRGHFSWRVKRWWLRLGRRKGQHGIDHMMNSARPSVVSAAQSMTGSKEVTPRSGEPATPQRSSPLNQDPSGSQSPGRRAHFEPRPRFTAQAVNSNGSTELDLELGTQVSGSAAGSHVERFKSGSELSGQRPQDPEHVEGCPLSLQPVLMTGSTIALVPQRSSDSSIYTVEARHSSPVSADGSNLGSTPSDTVPHTHTGPSIRDRSRVTGSNPLSRVVSSTSQGSRGKTGEPRDPGGTGSAGSARGSTPPAPDWQTPREGTNSRATTPTFEPVVAKRDGGTANGGSVNPTTPRSPTRQSREPMAF